MAWKEIRDDLAATLLTVAITSPSAASITKVYATPPAAIDSADLPCFIIMSPRRHVERTLGGLQRLYTVRCRLLIQDGDKDVAADIVDAFAEAVIDAFNGNLKLASASPFGVIIAQDIDEPGALTAGGKQYSGFDCTYTLNIRGAATLAA